MVGVTRTPPLLVLRKRFYFKRIPVTVASEAGHSLSCSCSQQFRACAERYTPLETKALSP
jgi:hypothetical protein